MLIPCTRCKKNIPSPDDSNADYILTATGTEIICPDCYKESDTLIWGIHKGTTPGAVKSAQHYDLVAEIESLKARLDRPNILVRAFNKVRTSLGG